MKKAATRISIALLMVLASVFAFTLPALAESGSVTLVFGAIYDMTLTRFGDRVIATGDATGVAMNKAGSGFLHNTPFYCKIVVDTGMLTGYCQQTDKDGDKVYSSVKRNIEAGTPGNFQFFSGTGKYTGISGGGTYTVENLSKLEDGRQPNIAIFTGNYSY